MRIIAGRFKGHRLPSPRGKNVRPTTDRVREAVFSSIGSAVCGTRVLELFAGTGAFGFEALSRGADSVVFVDSDRRVTDLLSEAAQALAVQAQVSILNTTAHQAVKRLAGRSEEFGIIFLDPPYSRNHVAELLSSHLFPNLLAGRGLVITERATHTAQFEAPAAFEKIFERSYGATVVAIFREKPADF